MMNFDEQTTQSDMMMTGGTDDYILNNGETSPSAWNGFPGLVDPNQVFTRLQTTITPNDAKFVYSIPVNSSEEGNRRKRKRPDGTFSTNIGYKNKELLWGLFPGFWLSLEHRWRFPVLSHPVKLPSGKTGILRDMQAWVSIAFPVLDFWSQAILLTTCHYVGTYRNETVTSISNIQFKPW